MDGQGLQTLKPPASVIHRHPAVIFESLIHFASVQDLTKSISVFRPFEFVLMWGERSKKIYIYNPRREDKITAHCAVSKHSLSGNNHLTSYTHSKWDMLIKWDFNKHQQ